MILSTCSGRLHCGTHDGGRCIVLRMTHVKPLETYGHAQAHLKHQNKSGARHLRRRCNAVQGAGTLPQSQRHQLRTQSYTEGTCGLRGVTSPALLQAYYNQAVGPRLQRQYAAVQRSNPSSAMAELLDSLWCDLKTILSTSRHIASR